MKDYIVVGFGLAGLALVEHLEHQEKSYIVFEDSSQKASRVAGGLYNPVILKRFTAAWNAAKQFDYAVKFYEKVQSKLEGAFIEKIPILRRFNSVEEQNMWFEACDKPVLRDFLSTELVKNTNLNLDIPNHYGKVKHTGKIQIKHMLSLYLQYINDKGSLENHSFNHQELIVNNEFVEYRGIKAKHIVFCEGFGVIDNMFFKHLPLVGNKGEYIVIKSPELKLNEIVKSSVFLIPLGNDMYKVGATYNNQDKSQNPTSSARKQLEEKLAKFLKTDYTVVDQVAGVRPTVKDRKPLVGTHETYSNIHLLNGLGTRGIIIAPSIASELLDSIEKGKPLSPEIDFNRFN